MKIEELKNNIIDVIKESQIKLGYEKSFVSLYYPLEVLNNLLEVQYEACEMQEKLSEQMQDIIELGKIEVSHRNGRFCIKVSEEGNRYVHENIADNPFLHDFLKCIQLHCTKEDIIDVFHKHSNDVVVEDVDTDEFDFLIYFDNGKPDAYRYCVHFEGGHAIYHRFSKKEYELYNF